MDHQLNIVIDIRFGRKLILDKIHQPLYNSWLKMIDILYEWLK